MFPIDIPKRSQVCSKDNQILSPGMDYFSTLILDEKKSGFVRHDYCMKCWLEIEKKEQSLEITSKWKSTVPKKQNIELPKLKDERALYLLKELLSNDDFYRTPQLQNEAFVLSLFLSRKRLMLFRGDLEKNALSHTLYEVKETEEMLLVPKLDLSSDQIEQTKLSLAEKFNAK